MIKNMIIKLQQQLRHWYCNAIQEGMHVKGTSYCLVLCTCACLHEYLCVQAVCCAVHMVSLNQT